VQLGDHLEGEPHVKNHDTERWIPREKIDTKLHKRPRAMSDSESEMVDKILDEAYQRAVQCLEKDPSTFVPSGLSNGGSPAEAVMFYIYLAVFFEMKTYVDDYPGVILRRDWQSVQFYNATVDREKDNFIEFKEDQCILVLNTHTKTNPDGSLPRKVFKLTGTRLADFLRLWQPHAQKMQNQTFTSKKKKIRLQVPAPYVVCHYACKQTTVYGKAYTKRGDFYTAVKKSVLNYLE
jgi:hypothetical protein